MAYEVITYNWLAENVEAFDCDQCKICAYLLPEDDKGLASHLESCANSYLYYLAKLAKQVKQCDFHL